jgi:ATP-dependent Lon protease
MEMEITLPPEVPAMTLPGVAFFPHAMLPLHIFEPRYRQMLGDVLATDRLFAVAGLDPRPTENPATPEPPHRIASVGIIRACQKNDNGTSNLLLQGLCRVEILGIVADTPYRRIAVRALTSEPGAHPAINAALRGDLLKLLAVKAGLFDSVPRGFSDLLNTVEDPDAFADIAAFGFSDDARIKQKLLETLNVHERLQRIRDQLGEDIIKLQVHRALQGRLPDDRIADN